MLEQRIEQDLKTALLAGDTKKVSTLRLLKSALLDYKVANGKRQTGLSDAEVTTLLAKEAKKRSETSEIYRQSGNDEHAEAEEAERMIIEQYLPKQLSENEIAVIIAKTIESAGASGVGDMGRVIASVKEQTNGAADGSLIARLTKEKLGI